MSKKTRERRSRRDSWDKDRQDKEGGGGFYKRAGFLVGEDVLSELSVSEYRTEGGEDGAQAINKFHLLPAHSEDQDNNLDVIALRIYAHYDVGANGEAFLCPQWMHQYFKDIGFPVPEIIEGGKCPICEEHARLLAKYLKGKSKFSQDERDSLYAELRALRPHSDRYDNPKPKRYFAWVVDATDEDTENKGVRYYFMPVKVYEEGVLDQSEGEDEEFIDILDPEKGRIFQFKRTGKGREDTRYSSYKLRSRDYSVGDWAKDVPRFFDVLKFHTYEEMAEALGSEPKEVADNGEKVKDELEDEVTKDEDRPRTRRRRKATEDDEPKDTDDDDASEDVKKIRERRRKRQVQREENEDD